MGEFNELKFVVLLWACGQVCLKRHLCSLPPTSAHFPTEIWLHSDYFFHLVRNLSPSKGHDYELSDVLEPWSTSPCPAQYWAQSGNRVSCLGCTFGEEYVAHETLSQMCLFVPN